MKCSTGSSPLWGQRDERAKNGSDGQGDQVQQAVAIAPKARTVCPKARPSGRAGRPARPAPKKRTQGIVAPAFLAQRFFPLMDGDSPDLTATCKLEQDFYASAENLCALYGWEMPAKSGLPFPFGMARDLELLREKVSDLDSKLYLRFLLDDNCKATLATLKTYCTQTTLFYIPVLPLLKLLEDSERRQLGELMQSVMAYLLQVVGIPHFAQDWSYLGSMYEMLSDWWSEEEYAECEQQRLEHEAFFEQLWERGAVSLHLLAQRTALDNFGEHINGFKAENDAERDFLKTAVGFSELYRAYPERSIKATMLEPFGAADHEGIIRWEQYLHFFWDFEQLVNDQFMDCINAELNECGLMEEPMQIQYFHKPQEVETEDFAFEQRLFGLLHELIDHLNILDR